jgi:AmmeMemoRadiSam system protein A
MSATLTDQERHILLELARQAMTEAVTHQAASSLDLSKLPVALREPGATFVTLTCGGELRGCIGALEAYQPLAEDVRQHAIAAALQDYRFPPVESAEIHSLEIEISRLTRPVSLPYTIPEDLINKLRPGVDGVLLRYAGRRATFLPQVWQKLPDPIDFLDHLCAKMGLEPTSWRYLKLDVYVYQVEEFRESRHLSV